jgi:hypothetical protein
MLFDRKLYARIDTDLKAGKTYAFRVIPSAPLLSLSV